MRLLAIGDIHGCSIALDTLLKAIDPHQPLIEQPSEKLFWEKFNFPAPHLSGKTMICGHTPQRDGRPLNIGHAVCIDTWACGGQWLTGLDVQTGEIWQANQQGQIRTGRIANFRHRQPLQLVECR